MSRTKCEGIKDNKASNVLSRERWIGHAVTGETGRNPQARRVWHGADPRGSVAAISYNPLCLSIRLERPIVQILHQTGGGTSKKK